jgi:hypothetical protein
LIFVKLLLKLVLAFLLALLWFSTFGFYKLSFKLFFCKKSFRLDLFSFIVIGKFGKFVVFNISSLEPKNSQQSFNCFFTLALRDDIIIKYCKGSSYANFF